MTIQEFEEKQRLYAEIEKSKKRLKGVKKILEEVKDPKCHEQATEFYIHHTFEKLVDYISISEACPKEDMRKELFNILIYLTDKVYKLETKMYEQLLVDFTK